MVSDSEGRDLGVASPQRWRAVVLGAGPPHRGTRPASVTDTPAGESVLQWQAAALGLGIEELLFVSGFGAQEIRERFPSLKVMENPRWADTGSAGSLMQVIPVCGGPLVVCYGDVLFRRETVKTLLQCEADIVVAYDGSARDVVRDSDDVIVPRERVVIHGEEVRRLGDDLMPAWSSGEFVGLVRLSSALVARLQRWLPDVPREVEKRGLSTLIEYLRLRGTTVSAVDVLGDWAELREPSDLVRFVLGTKADSLARLRALIRRGSVPTQVTFAVRHWKEHPEKVLKRIGEAFPDPDRSLAVRSSTRREDTFDASGAGQFASVLGVSRRDGLGDAIEEVIASYGESADGDQVLVQTLVSDVVMSGVAFTRTLGDRAPWYVINYEVTGRTDGITSGRGVEHSTLYLRRGVDPPRPFSALMGVIQEVEELLQHDCLDIEFAVDRDGVIHLLQVRPLLSGSGSAHPTDQAIHESIGTAQTVFADLSSARPPIPPDVPAAYGVMPDWNPAEIIGTAPRRLAESLYRYLILDDVWATQRAEFGYRDVRPAPLLVSFAGRPYVDVRASLASFLPADLPDELSARVLRYCVARLWRAPALHDKIEFEVLPTCLGPGFGRWEALWVEEAGLSSEDVAQIRRGLLAMTSRAFDVPERMAPPLTELVDRHAKTLASDLPPLAKVAVLLEDAKRFGTLPFAHLARCGFVAVAILREARDEGLISDRAHDAFFSSIRTVSHEFSRDVDALEAGRLPLEEFVDAYGHLRPGTYDILSPSYAGGLLSALEGSIRSARQGRGCVEEPLPVDLWLAERPVLAQGLRDLGLDVTEECLEQFLRAAIEGRERAKFLFTRNLSAALDLLVEVGERYGLSKEDTACLSIQEILAWRDRPPETDRSRDLLLRRVALNRAEQSIAERVRLPDLLFSIQDFDVFMVLAGVPTFVGRTRVTASVVHLHGDVLRDASDLAGQIVLIPQADPGFDWIFAQGIAGLVTMYGGANSHMAIRSAEFGLPAAIGVGEERFNKLKSASVIEIDPIGETLRVLR